MVAPRTAVQRPPRVIVLLTDFGTRDWYVAAIKGVILSRAPGAQVVDLTHEIPAYDIAVGAFTLLAAADWFPHETIFLCVVDPGVGTRRRLLAARADNRYFIGPDNGLLGPCLRRASACKVVQLTSRRYWLPVVSRTFQGRDIMAPVAAALAQGIPLDALGTPTRRCTMPQLPRVRRRGRRLLGEVIHIDRFGNLITNISATDIKLGGRHVGAVRLACAGAMARMVSSYGAVRAGRLTAVIGSLGYVELAVRNGSAEMELCASRGTVVEAHLAA